MHEGMQGWLNVIIVKVKVTWLGNALSQRGLGMLHDPCILDGQAAQTTIPNTTAFQTEDLDAYDSDCDDVSNAKAVLMANLSNYGSDVILEEKNSESLTIELERYKERVKTFEQRLNIDLSTREKMIDSQMDDMIKEKLALKQQINSLEQNLSNQIKENESLLQTFTVFKNEFKEKESKYLDKEIDLQKKIKELDNIVYKVSKSAQTVHMLTKPQVFYDDTHKQALGYQNPFYLKKSQQIKPTLYDGSVISSQHVASPMIDDEETLILEEVELSNEQAFWLQTSHPNTDQSALSPVKIEAPRELPKVSLVNTSLRKLKYHLGQFDTVVKKRITPNAITEGEWGFEHTKTVILNEIIPFLKTLKDIFNVFDKDLLNELTMQLNQENFQKDSLSNNQNALEIPRYFKNNNLKAQLQAKDTTICKLKEHIKSMRENNKEEKVKHEMDEIETINIELEHKHGDSLIAQLNSKSMENADLKRQIQDKVFVITSLKNNLRKLKGKEIVENAAQLPIATTIAPGMFKIDLEPLAPSNQCMFDANHDVCFLDFVNDMNVRAKSKSVKKSQHHNIWKPTGKVFTKVGHKWKPTGRLFTIVGNSCPLTKITPKKIMHLKETTSNLVETPNPEIKVYSRRPKQIKSVGSSKKAKIVESKIANNSEPTQLWESNATDVPSSSSLVNDRSSRLFSSIWTPDAQNI
ncbi:hypothetical protein Tco_0202088 [Tanacetum coccineum]